MKENISLAVAAVAILLAVVTWFHLPVSPSVGAATTPGGMLLEQYTPVVQYNGGIKTALPVALSSSATTTLFVKSSSTSQGWCTEFNATGTVTVENMTFAATTGPSSFGILPVVGYGACN